MGRRNRMAAEALHLWLQPGQPPAPWMCNQNVVIWNDVDRDRLESTANALGLLQSEVFDRAIAVLGTGWEDKDVGYLALQMLLGSASPKAREGGDGG